MQTQFDGFESGIIKKIIIVKSLYLKGIHEELFVLWDSIEDMYTQPFLLMSIIEKEVPYIWVVKGRTLLRKDLRKKKAIEKMRERG